MMYIYRISNFFFFQAEDGIRDWSVTGVQTCALPIYLAKRGVPVLYLTNEQSLADIAGVVDRVTTGLGQSEADAIKANLFCDDTVPEIKDLPDFLARRVLSDGQEYHGSKVLVYDSIQGRG